jgi:hypothetical protein
MSACATKHRLFEGAAADSYPVHWTPEPLSGESVSGAESIAAVQVDFLEPVQGMLEEGQKIAFEDVASEEDAEERLPAKVASLEGPGEIEGVRQPQSREQVVRVDLAIPEVVIRVGLLVAIGWKDDRGIAIPAGIDGTDLVVPGAGGASRPMSSLATRGSIPIWKCPVMSTWFQSNSGRAISSRRSTSIMPVVESGSMMDGYMAGLTASGLPPQ